MLNFPMFLLKNYLICKSDVIAPDLLREPNAHVNTGKQ